MARQRYGVHLPLEEEATRLIRESLRGVTSHEAKADILTAWKETDRRRREVYTASGSPDGAVRRGMFHRGLNASRPELNSRGGHAQPRSDSLAAFTQEHGVSQDDDA